MMCWFGDSGDGLIQPTFAVESEQGVTDPSVKGIVSLIIHLFVWDSVICCCQDLFDWLINDLLLENSFVAYILSLLPTISGE